MDTSSAADHGDALAVKQQVLNPTMQTNVTMLSAILPEHVMEDQGTLDIFWCTVVSQIPNLVNDGHAPKRHLPD